MGRRPRRRALSSSRSRSTVGLPASTVAPSRSAASHPCVGVPTAHHARRAADVQHREQVGDQLVGARQRRRPEADIVGPHAQAFGDATGRPHRRLVGEAGTLRRALTCPRCTTGGRRRSPRPVGGRSGAVPAAPPNRPLRPAARRSTRSARPRAGSAVALDRGEVVAGVDEDPWAGVVDVVVERVRVLQVDQCGDRAQTPRSEHGGEVVETVVREDADAVAAADAEGRRARRRHGRSSPRHRRS